jgi:hypothetical protein
MPGRARRPELDLTARPKNISGLSHRQQTVVVHTYFAQDGIQRNSGIGPPSQGSLLRRQWHHPTSAEGSNPPSPAPSRFHYQCSAALSDPSPPTHPAPHTPRRHAPSGAPRRLRAPDDSSWPGSARRIRGSTLLSDISHRCKGCRRRLSQPDQPACCVHQVVGGGERRSWTWGHFSGIQIGVAAIHCWSGVALVWSCCRPGSTRRALQRLALITRAKLGAVDGYKVEERGDPLLCRYWREACGM